MSEVGRERLVLGELTARIDGADLRDVTWRDADVANRLYVAVRDVDWGTVPAEVRELRVEPWGRGAEVHFELDHTAGGAPLLVRGTYHLTPDHVVATLEGEWTGPWETNRTGWCLLHPLSHVGGRVDTSLGGSPGVGRPVPELVIPQRIDADGAPVPAWGPFDQLGVTAGGIHIDHHFEGDRFETEDQRNWSDASFKTYGTPAAEPRPKKVRAGEKLFQRITIRFENAVQGQRERSGNSRGAMVLLGLIDDVVPDSVLAGALAVVGGVRARIRGGDADAAARIMRQAATAPVWDLEVLAGPETDWSAIRAAVPPTPPARLLVLPDSEPPGAGWETTPAEWVAAARAALGDVVAEIGGGTLRNLAELQRHPLDGFDVVSFTYSPRVHAVDATSVEETLGSYRAMVATARARSAGAVVSVGPLRDPDGLPPGWVGRSVAAWRDAGADVLCIGSVRDVAALLGGM